MGQAPVAADACARRLRALGAAGALDEVALALGWFGPTGFAPDRPGSEASVQALAGLMQVDGRDDGRPRRLGLEVASVAAGVVAAQGVLAAAVGGAGAVQTSVLQAALVLLSHYFMVATGLGDAVPGPPLPEPGPPFRSAEGRWFEVETLDPEAWKAFWTRLGAGGADLGRGWTVFRWRYERAACSLPPGLHEATAGHRLDDLRRVAAETGLSLVPVAGGPAPVAEPPVASVCARPGGGAPAGTAGTAAAAGLPLAGTRVVEATSRIQGPFAGMLLRMLGAEVVRVQPPEGDYGRAAVTLHRGKDAVALDLGSPAGRRALVDLVAGADVFLHNWRPGKAAEWRLEFDDLARPGLVYAHATGWAAPREALGTDFLVQAHLGLGHGLRPEGEPPFPSRMILCDLFGALVTAEGILAALYRRAREGGAYEVGSSLEAGGRSLLDGHPGRPRWGALDRPVPTAAGLLAVSVDGEDGLRRACAACRVAGPEALVARLGEDTAAHWEGVLTGAGVPAAAVAEDLAAVAADPRLAGLFEPAGPGLAPRAPWSFT
ncbi:MAG TPA: CoA transferase [Acidimicrobiales bacterium]|nr:CoA transferase [Acidimicrobiales bacterium]HWH34743.1 CoA transferase [Acidimicrobiales bacterium]